MKLFRIGLGASLATLAVIASAQSGIGTFSPDSDKALHVVAKPTQDPLRLEGLKIGVDGEDDVVVTDANGRLRYRPISDLTVSGEWEYNGTSHIYARRAQAGGHDVVVTDDGELGIGTTDPSSYLDVGVDGDFVTPTGGGLARFGGNARYIGMDENEIGAFDSGAPSSLNLNVDGGEVRIGAGNASLSLLRAYGQAQVETLTTGDMDGVGGDDQFVTATGAGLLRKVPASSIAAFEWRDHSSGDYIYANRARAAGRNVVVTDDGEIGIGRTNPESRLDVNGTARIRNLPDGVVNEADPANDDWIVLADRTTNELRRISPNDLFDDEGEWVYEGGGGNEDRVYARRAREDGGQDVVIDETGRVGIGRAVPTESLHIDNGGIRIEDYDVGISFGREIPRPGPATFDGARIYNSNALGGFADALIFEKTDFNHGSVDGGFVWASRQNANNRVIHMSLRGNGNVGIGNNLIDPTERLHVHGNGLFQDAAGSTGFDALAGLIKIVDDANTYGNYRRGVQVADGGSNAGNGEVAYFGMEPRATNDHHDAAVMWGRDDDRDLHFTHLNGTTGREVMMLDGERLNVGIGLTLPLDGSTRLDVNGRVRVRDLDQLTAYDETSDLIVIADNDGNLRTVTADVFKQDFEDLDWTINGNEIHNANTGSVGIGLTNPADTVTLHVGGLLRMENASAIELDDDDVRLLAPTDGRFAIEAHTTTTFENRSSTGVDPLIVDHNNSVLNIGIGSPDNKLSALVDGIMRMDDQSEMHFGTSTRNRIYAETGTDFRVVANSLWSVRDDGNTTGILTVNADNERVGIRRNNPEDALDVDGLMRLRNVPVANGYDQFLVIDPASGRVRRRDLDQFVGPWDNAVGTPGRAFLRNRTDRVGIGIDNPSSKLHLFEDVGTAPSAAGGSFTLQHGDSSGYSSIVFRSRNNTTSDHGYLSYASDGSGNGSNVENGLLELGTQNDGVGNNDDDIAIMASGRVGVGTRAPQNDLHVVGGIRIDGLATNPSDPLAVTTDANGDFHTQPISSIKDNLGDHELDVNVHTDGHYISYDGTDQGILITDENNMSVSGRLQIGNSVGSWVDDNITAGGLNEGFHSNDGAIFIPVRQGTRSDLRLYITDNRDDAFSIWGSPCASDCGDLNASSQVAKFLGNGQIQFNALSGGGTRMVVANPQGILSTQPIPSGGGGGTADNLGNHRATTDVQLRNHYLRNNNSTNSRSFRILDDGTLDMVRNRHIRFGNVFHNRLQQNGNDMELRANNNLELRARNRGVEIRANDDVRIRAGEGNGDEIQLETDDVRRVTIENDGRIRVHAFAGGGTRVVRADNNGRLFPSNTSSDGLWERDPGNAETFLSNNGDDVGIGLDNPDAKLHIYGNDGSDTPIMLRLSNQSNNGRTAVGFLEGNANDDSGIVLEYDQQQGDGGGTLLFRSRAGGADEVRAALERDGQFGIGANVNPQTVLHVQRTPATGALAELNAPARIRVQNTVNDGSSGIEFQEGTRNSDNFNADEGMSVRFAASSSNPNALQIIKGDVRDVAPANVHLSVAQNDGEITIRHLGTTVDTGTTEILVADNNGTLTTRAFQQTLWTADDSNPTIGLDGPVAGYSVGIGTSVPTAKLDIDGDLRVRSLVGTPAGLASDPIVTIDPSTGRLRTRDASAFENFWTRDPGSGALYAKTSADNVGIGESNPSAKLHVDGDAIVTSMAAGTVGTHDIVVVDGGGLLRKVPADSFDDFWDRQSAGSQDYLELSTATDFVGIGTTTTPTAQLHTTGDVRFEGLATAIDDELVIADAFGNLSTRPLPAEYWDRDATGNGTNGYTYAAFGADYVGVGTSTPATKFHVDNGQVTITDIVSNNGDEDVDRVVVATPSGELRSLDAGLLNSPFRINDPADGIQQRDLSLDVGLGTATPDAALHVYRDAANASTEIQVHNRQGNGSSQIRFRENLNNAETNSMLLRYSGTQNRLEVTNGWGDATGATRTDSFATHMVVMRNNGRVGVNLGADNPTQQLDVDGNIRIRDDHRIIFNEDQSYIDDATGGNTGDLTMQASQELVLRGREAVRIRAQGASGDFDVEADRHVYIEADDRVLVNARGENLDLRAGQDFDVEADRHAYIDAEDQVRVNSRTEDLDLRSGDGSGDEMYFRRGGTTYMTLHDDGRFELRNSSATWDLENDGASLLRGDLRAQSEVRFDDLDGGGTQMVVADDDGILAKQPIPTIVDDQTISYDATTGLLSISGTSGSTVQLGTEVSIDDQDLQLNATTDQLTLTNDATPVNLSVYRDNTDAQALDYDATTGLLSITGNAGTIDLASEVTIDDQQLSISGNVISLTNSPDITLPAGSDDQALTLVGDALTLEDGGAAISLAAYRDNTDAQDLTYEPSTGILTLTRAGVADRDIDLSNAVEIDDQELSISGNVISLTNSPDITLPAGSDNQDLSQIGGVLSLTNDGSAVDLTGVTEIDDQQLGWDDATRTLTLTNSTSVVIPAGAGAGPSGFSVSGTNVTTDAGVTDVGIGTVANPADLLVNGDIESTGVMDAIGITTETLDASDYVTVGTTRLGTNALSVSGDVRAIGTIQSTTSLSTNLITTSAMVTNLAFKPTRGYIAGDLLTIDAAGNVGFVSRSVASDERLKRDLTPMTGALDKIGQLRNVSYRYRDDVDAPGLALDTATHYGLIAQDVAAVFPHAVTKVGDYLALEERELTGVLFAAVNELRVANEALAARNARLEADLADVRAENTELERDVHGLSAQTRELQANMVTVLQYIEEASQHVQAAEH